MSSTGGNHAVNAITKHENRAHPDAEVSSQRKLAALNHPSAYPEDTQCIEMRETHMSWVFLTDHMAYKLKKPVRHAFLDFSTLAARRWDCREEVRLNRRLAKGIYFGVVPLVLTNSGRLRIGAAGTTVDWLVKMRRLPSEQMLDCAIQADRADPGVVTRAARLIAEFYANAQPVLVSPDEYKGRLASEVETNRSVLRETSKLPSSAVNRICDRQQHFIVDGSYILRERVYGRRIIEAHGDLRPEHIFLGSPPAVIDCLEFDRRLRVLDPPDELAFLAIECERMGDRRVGERFMSVYCETVGDMVPAALVDFYKSCRACLRARIAVWHVREPGPKGTSHWWSTAREYLRLADTYAASLCRH